MGKKKRMGGTWSKGKTSRVKVWIDPPVINKRINFIDAKLGPAGKK